MKITTRFLQSLLLKSKVLKSKALKSNVLHSLVQQPLLLLPLLLSSFLLLTVSTTVVAQSDKKDEVIKRYSAIPDKSVNWGTGGLPEKLAFKFDNANAWLRENGDFGLEAEVKHGWLMCGTYEVAVRFGIGIPACTNVSWISQPSYVRSHKQCNNSWMVHSGNGSVPTISDDFENINCAQLIIKCTGKCK